MRRLLLALLLACATLSPAQGYWVDVGSYAVGGTASDNRDVTISTNAQIDLLIIKCDAASHSVWRTSAMSGDVTSYFATAGNATSNRIQSLGVGTFQLGTNAEVQSLSTTCYYAAFGMDQRLDMAVGSYVANTATCLDDCNVALTPAFAPGLVWLRHRSGGTGAAIWRSSTHVGDVVSQFTNTANTGDMIQAFTSTGFQYGNSATVNTNGVTYDYVAFKDIANSAASGSFTGNAVDDRDIATIASPLVALTKPDSGGASACMRFGTAGDLSWAVSNIAPTTNQIQSFSGSGFQVGTATCVNQNSQTLYWWVTKQPVYPSRRPAHVLFFR